MATDPHNTQESIAKKAQAEFADKPIRTTGVFVGILVGLIAVATAAWAVRSTLTLYVLPAIVGVGSVVILLRSRAQAMADLSLSLELRRHTILRSEVLLIAITLVSIGGAAGLASLAGRWELERRALTLMPESAEVKARLHQIPERTSLWGLYGMFLITATAGAFAMVRLQKAVQKVWFEGIDAELSLVTERESAAQEARQQAESQRSPPPMREN